MRYIDSGTREADQAVAHWMGEVVGEGIASFHGQSGYFHLSGMGVLLDGLKETAASGGAVRLVLGANNGATIASHIAYLAGQFDLACEHVGLTLVRYGVGLFHPKVYHFERPDGSQTAYVGSANFTRNGLSGLNVEAGLVLDTRSGDPGVVLDTIRDRIALWFDDPGEGAYPITSTADIEALIASNVLGVDSKGASESEAETDAEADEAVGQPAGTGPQPAMGASLKPLVTVPSLGSIGALAAKASEAAALSLAPKEGVWKVLSKFDASPTSAPGSVIIPKGIVSAFPAVGDAVVQPSGGTQAEISFPLRFHDGGKVLQTDARLIRYQPAPEHPRPNTEHRLAFHNRSINPDSVEKDDVLVFERKLKGEDGVLFDVFRLRPDDARAIELKAKGRFGEF